MKKISYLQNVMVKFEKSKNNLRMRRIRPLARIPKVTRKRNSDLVSRHAAGIYRNIDAAQLLEKYPIVIQL